MTLEPIPQTVEAVEEFGPFTGGDDDLLAELGRRAERLVVLVPQTVGLSLAFIDDGITFTLVATSEQIASLDAVQYLSGGPCETAAYPEHVEVFDGEEVLDERRWRHFAAATAADGISSTLSLPVLAHSRVIGTVNLYASTPDAFDGHHEAVAAVFGAWAPGAVANADLAFTTRDRAERAPQDLRDEIDVKVASSLLADEEGVGLEQARARLQDAAQRAGLELAHLARVLIRVGPTQDHA